MELVYLWIEKYKNIEKQEFNFSPHFSCSFEDGVLRIEERKYKSIFPVKKNYQSHKAIIAEIIKRKEIYLDSRIDGLYKEFDGRLYNSKDELIGLIYCNYIDKKDINKRPLSKLTKDILEQLR